MDKTNDSSDIYEYLFNNTESSPIIGTNSKRGIIDERLNHARKNGIEIRRKEAAKYSLRRENYRTFEILEDILGFLGCK